MSSILKGITNEAIQSPEFDRKIKNIVRQNPKGSADEKMILNRFLATPMVQDFNLKGQEWINQAHEWLQTVKSDLQKKYPDADLSDLEELAHKMYEDYLARVGNLEETTVFSEDEDLANLVWAVLEKYFDDGLPEAQIAQMFDIPVYRVRKILSDFDEVMNDYEKKNKLKDLSTQHTIHEFLDTSGGGGSDDDELRRQVIEMYFEDGLRETEISKIVGISEIQVHQIINDYEQGKGIDEHINTPGGMGQSYRKYKVKPSGIKENMDKHPLYQRIIDSMMLLDKKFVSKIEPKLLHDAVIDLLQQTLIPAKANVPQHHVDRLANHLLQMMKIKQVGETAIPMFTPEDKMVNANDPRSDGWRVYKTKPSGILEGIITEYDTKTIDQVVERLPNGLTVNNFTIPAFKEYLHNKYYAVEKPNWKQLVGHFAREYRQKHGIKEYKLGDLNHFDNMLLALPKGLSAEQINIQGFKEFIYEKHGNKEWPNFKKNRFAYWDAYQKAGKTQEKKKFLGLFDEETNENLLQTYGDQLGLDEVEQARESNIMKGLQSEALKKSKEVFTDKEKEIIRNLWDLENEGSLQDKDRYLVYTSKHGIEYDQPTLDLAMSNVKGIYKQFKVLDYPVLVYDRKSKTPIYFDGYEDYLKKTTPNKLTAHEGYSAGAVGGAGLGEEWSKKYKKSINCNNPKGFSQKAHCAGRKARQAGKHTKSSSVNEYGEVDSQRKVEFSKENPPSLDYLYQQFIHNMLSSTNKIDPKVWIDNANKLYGLNYTWKDYQYKGHKDYTNNWDKIVKKYILGK